MLNDKPGPLGFLSVIRPSLKMTARSYSFTIWMLETQQPCREHKKDQKQGENDL